MQLGVLAVNLRGRGFTAQVTRAGTRGCVNVANANILALEPTGAVGPPRPTRGVCDDR